MDLFTLQEFRVVWPTSGYTLTQLRVKEKNCWWKSAKRSTSHTATRTQMPCSGPGSVIFPLGLGGILEYPLRLIGLQLKELVPDSLTDTALPCFSLLTSRV